MHACVVFMALTASVAASAIVKRDDRCVWMHLQENIGAFDNELPPECLADIEDLNRKFRDPAMS